MSKLSENIRMALTALLTNKFRALLTTIGIGIGIAAVVILVSLGEAVQNYVTRQFLSIGSDLIYVAAASSSNGFGPRTGRGGVVLSSLTTKDVALISDSFNVPNVKTVIPMTQLNRPAFFGRSSARVPIYATTPDYFPVLNRQIASGRLFDEQDLSSGARVAVLGQTTVKNLFGTDVSPLGENVRIGDVPFKVIGTLEVYGGSTAGPVDQDDLIAVPITAAQAHLQSDRTGGGALPVSVIFIQAANLDSIDDIVSTTTDIIRKEHKIKPGKDDDFQVTALKDLLNSFQQVIGLLTLFLAVVGGISLLVGGIGVMNIMLVTVTERTKEIGLRKAVGARGIDVMLQFLTEAVVLCAVGGAAGLTLATVVTYIIGQLVPDLQPAVSVTGVVLAVGITTLIGVFFGLYPAGRAAALSPIQALRTE